MQTCTLFMRQSIATRLTCSMSTVTKQKPVRYCLELVRKYDYENFLCTLLLPANVRAAAFAIRAFNVQIAMIEDQVTNNDIGAMRYKFWEEALNQIYSGNPPENPIALDLYRILDKHDLSKHFFKRLIKARAKRLSNAIFPNIEAIEKYSENTVSSVYYLLLEASGIKSIAKDHIASHLGKAHGIVTLIRSIPHNAQKQINVLPQDILLKHNVSEETVIRGQFDKKLCDAIFDVSLRAQQHLSKAKNLIFEIQNNNSPIFLSSTVIDLYLARLNAVDFYVFDPTLQRRSALLPLKLYWQKFTS